MIDFKNKTKVEKLMKIRDFMMVGLIEEIYNQLGEGTRAISSKGIGKALLKFFEKELNLKLDNLVEKDYQKLLNNIIKIWKKDIGIASEISAEIKEKKVYVEIKDCVFFYITEEIGEALGEKINAMCPILNTLQRCCMYCNITVTYKEGGYRDKTCNMVLSIIE